MTKSIPKPHLTKGCYMIGDKRIAVGNALTEEELNALDKLEIAVYIGYVEAEDLGYRNGDLVICNDVYGVEKNIVAEILAVRGYEILVSLEYGKYFAVDPDDILMFDKVKFKKTIA